MKRKRTTMTNNFKVFISECFGYGYDAGTEEIFDNARDAIAYADSYQSVALVCGITVMDGNGKIIYHRDGVRK